MCWREELGRTICTLAWPGSPGLWCPHCLGPEWHDELQAWEAAWPTCPSSLDDRPAWSWEMIVALSAN